MSDRRGRLGLFGWAVGWAVLGLLVVLALVDGARPWRRLQVEFLRLEADHLVRRRAAELDRRSERLAELETRAEEARRGLDDRLAEVAELEGEISQLEGQRRRAEERWRKARETGAVDQARAARREAEALAEGVSGRREQRATLFFDLEAVERERGLELAEVERIDQQLETVGRLAWLRDLPWLGGFVPPVAIRERVAEAAVRRLAAKGGRDVGFAPGGPVPVERCTTCHLGADRDDLAETNWSPPFRPHPRRNLFVGPDSPHPVERFGCVVCHGGEGRATDFAHAGHRPRDERQAADWRARFGGGAVARGAGLRPATDVSATMVPASMLEASCGRCHPGTLVSASFLEAAPALIAGRRLRGRLGCDGCHRDPETSASPSPRPWAPSLAMIASKTTSSRLERRLAAPGSHPWIDDLFVPLPDEPSIEGTAEAIARTERLAVVSALWQKSRRVELEEAPAGDAERGEQLFETLGCRACHVLRGADDQGQGVVDPRRLHGRSLASVGDRPSSWLFHWLLDPAGVEPGTRKADPGLDRDEAADLTAFLLATHAPAETDEERPPVDTALRDRLVLRELEALETLEDAAARLAAMGERERTLFLGERRLERRGCRGCHALAPRRVAGSEIAGAPAPPLDPPRLAPWLGGSDDGFSTHHYPVFRLSAEEARGVRLAWMADGPMSPGRSTGGELVEAMGCVGCHGFAGVPGALEDLESESPSETLPIALEVPPLDDIGTRLRPVWLTDLFSGAGGTAVRPWSKVRMPRYDLEPEEIESLVGFFLAREGVSWVDLEPAVADERQLALGRAAWELLQCDNCHLHRPSYDSVARRLRADWTADWLLDPRRHSVETAMPAVFVASEGAEPDSAFLLGSLEAPMFTTQYQRLRQVFDSEQELRDEVRDPQRMAEALRAWLWHRSKTPRDELQDDRRSDR